jgi:hypothetical protein
MTHSLAGLCIFDGELEIRAKISFDYNIAHSFDSIKKKGGGRGFLGTRSQ